MPDVPPAPDLTGAPLEVALVGSVRACRTCTFFWPTGGAPQPYGPYPRFDVPFAELTQPDPGSDQVSFPWRVGTTGPAGFPMPEVMDGCRKAPIMTIGINPNLTAFAPGPTGAAWAYPHFTGDGQADEWAKYAAYYRYRSIYQERFDPAFVRPYLAADGRVTAPRDGELLSADRPTDSPSFTLSVRYDGDSAPTPIPLAGTPGGPRWVVLVAPHARFAAGDLIAAKLDVPPGLRTELYRERESYYYQFVPVLGGFDHYLRQQGYTGRPLRMGEDVGQLDMVACASPHWRPDFLGGSRDSEQQIVDNCVSHHAWALKQLVQTRPAVLYLVGESSYDMFRDAFGDLLHRDPPLDERPADGAFTLLRQTTDPARPCYVEIKADVDGKPYQLRTRLVVTPHFSYDTNFVPQVRLSPDGWEHLQQRDPACAWALTTDPDITVVAPEQAGDFTAFRLGGTAAGPGDAAAKLAALTTRFPTSAGQLRDGFYDPHALMGAVLVDLYQQRELGFAPVRPDTGQVLTRTEGSCQFCVNKWWRFPEGCPYDKPDEPAPAPGHLARVAAAALGRGGHDDQH
jgi:hypothetical protein